jgi:hypothetical protein
MTTMKKMADRRDIENASSFQSAESIVSAVERIKYSDDDIIATIERAAATNNRVSGAYGVPERAKRLIVSVR